MKPFEEMLCEGSELSAKLVERGDLKGVLLSDYSSLSRYMAAAEIVDTLDIREGFNLLSECTAMPGVLAFYHRSPREDSVWDTIKILFWFAICCRDGVTPYPNWHD